MTEPRHRRGGGSLLVVFSTLLAGLGGYAIVTLMARVLGPRYAEFAVFWAILYLVIGTISGIQQEVSRGTTPSSSAGVKHKGVQLSVLASQLSLIIAGVTAILSFFFAPVFFSGMQAELSLAIIFGATLSVFVAVIAGGLYGTHSWRQLSILILSDVIFRFLLLFGVSFFTNEVVILAWASVFPFVLVIGLVLPISRNQINLSTRLDVGSSQAFLNLARTIAAAFGTSVLVSGFPALFAVAGGISDPQLMSAIIFALTLTRAPLVVGTLALQSLLVVTFRDYPGNFSRLLLKFGSIMILIGIIFSAAMYFAGGHLIAVLAGSEFVISPQALMLITFSSVPTGLLAVSGSAALSRKLHTWYSVSWISAAAVATSMLLIPVDAVAKIVIALVVGPLVGVALNVIGLLRKDHQI